MRKQSRRLFARWGCLHPLIRWVSVTFLRQGSQEKRKLVHSRHHQEEDRMEESTEQSWRALSEEILSGMKEWRLAHPKATLREIEQTASELVSRLQTRMVQDSAMSSPLADWQGLAPEQRPTCPACATALVPRGKRKRRLPGSGAALSNSSAVMEPVPRVGWDFSPWMTNWRSCQGDSPPPKKNTWCIWQHGCRLRMRPPSCRRS